MRRSPMSELLSRIDEKMIASDEDPRRAPAVRTTIDAALSKADATALVVRGGLEAARQGFTGTVGTVCSKFGSEMLAQRSDAAQKAAEAKVSASARWSDAARKDAEAAAAAVAAKKLHQERNAAEAALRAERAAERAARREEVRREKAAERARQEAARAEEKAAREREEAPRESC